MVGLKILLLLLLLLHHNHLALQKNVVLLLLLWCQLGELLGCQIPNDGGRSS